MHTDIATPGFKIKGTHFYSIRFGLGFESVELSVGKQLEKHVNDILLRSNGCPPKSDRQEAKAFACKT